jgi:hypothetical protein
MIGQRVKSLPPVWACYLLYQNLHSDTGIVLGSYEILCHEDGNTVFDFWPLLALLSPTESYGVEAVPPDDPAGKGQYQTDTT